MVRQPLGLVFVLALNDGFAFAQQLQPSPVPMYKLPINQDIILMTNGTPGISSVARQSPQGLLGIRQTDTCPTGTIAVCTNSTFPCCDVSFPVCCPSSSVCCSSTARCAQTTTGAVCCPTNQVTCPGGCCQANTTCCNQYCCTSDYDCKANSTTGALSCVFRFVPSTTSESTWQHRSAAGSQTEIDPVASAIAEQASQDAARRKYQITVGVAAGVSVGTIVLVMCLALWFYIRRRRSQIIAAQEARPDQDPTVTDSPIRHDPPIVMNNMGSSQQVNQVASDRSSTQSRDIVPPWMTDYLSSQLAAPYHHPPVHSPQPPPYIEDTGTNALLLHRDPEPSTYRVEKEM